MEIIGKAASDGCEPFVVVKAVQRIKKAGKLLILKGWILLHPFDNPCVEPFEKKAQIDLVIVDAFLNLPYFLE